MNHDLNKTTIFYTFQIQLDNNSMKLNNLDLGFL